MQSRGQDRVGSPKRQLMRLGNEVAGRVIDEDGQGPLSQIVLIISSTAALTRMSQSTGVTLPPVSFAIDSAAE
jgi:hypothetical protein